MENTQVVMFASTIPIIVHYQLPISSIMYGFFNTELIFIS